MGLPFNCLIRGSLFLCIFLRGKRQFHSMDPFEVEKLSPGLNKRTVRKEATSKIAISIHIIFTQCFVTKSRAPFLPFLRSTTECNAGDWGRGCTGSLLLSLIWSGDGTLNSFLCVVSRQDSKIKMATENQGKVSYFYLKHRILLPILTQRSP